MVPPKNIDSNLNTKQTSYFYSARSWADDVHVSLSISRSRYQIALILAVIVIFLLVIAILLLIPSEKLVPLIIHHYQDGNVTVSPYLTKNVIRSSALIKSEISRYVVNRESYQVSSYRSQYSLVNQLSSDLVSRQYIKSQSSRNPSSPINVLGTNGYRTVHIDSIVLLDKENQHNGNDKTQHHNNLAEVNFSTIDYSQSTQKICTRCLTAWISWSYHVPSSDPALRWKNWDGFIITRYSLEQRHV